MMFEKRLERGAGHIVLGQASRGMGRQEVPGKINRYPFP
jgi:hypothetical protein